MSIDFTVYKGSPNGIVKATSHRELGHNEVIVRITHSGVCGTDEHFVTSDMGLGHEGVGIVEKIAPGVTSVKVGDRVGFGYVHYFCGICEPCVSGTPPPSKMTVLTDERNGPVLCQSKGVHFARSR